MAAEPQTVKTPGHEVAALERAPEVEPSRPEVDRWFGQRVVGAGRHPPDLSGILASVDGASRVRLVGELQRRHGNAQVQRLLTDRPRQPGAAAAAVVARQATSVPAAKSKPAAVDSEQDAASNAARAAADVLQNQNLRLLGGVDSKYTTAISGLYLASVGTEAGKKLPPDRRLDLLEEALHELRPAFQTLAKDAEGRDWLASEVTTYAGRLRSSLNYQKAEERVGAAVLGPEGELFEIPEDADPKTQAKVLKSQLPKLIKTLALLNEQAIRFGHEGIHHLAKEMLEEAHIPAKVKGRPGDPGFLVELQNVLFVIDGMLLLSDEHLLQQLAEPHDIFGRVASYAEFVKAATEITWGAVGVTASFAWGIAKATELGYAARGVTAAQTGEVLAAMNAAVGAQDAAKYAAQASGLARTSGLLLANVVAGIEIVYGLALLFDPHSKDLEKIEGLKHVGMGVAWFGGSYLGGVGALGTAGAAKAGIGATLSAGAAVGAAASLGVLYLYFALQIVIEGTWLRVGIVAGWMTKAFETMGEAAHRIGADGKELAKAGILAATERDPAQKEALGRVEKAKAAILRSSVDHFLEKCEPGPYEVGAAYRPGNFTNLRKAFEPLLGLQGATSPEEATKAAIAVLEKITWCFEHAPELLNEAAGLKAPKREAAAEH
jgi:hypothetical protein